MKTQQSRFYHGDQLRIGPQTIRELINYPVSLPSIQIGSIYKADENASFMLHNSHDSSPII